MIDNIAGDVEPANKDTYLFDAEFQKKFGCNCDAFESSSIF